MKTNEEKFVEFIQFNKSIIIILIIGINNNSLSFLLSSVDQQNGSTNILRINHKVQTKVSIQFLNHNVK